MAGKTIGATPLLPTCVGMSLFRVITARSLLMPACRLIQLPSAATCEGSTCHGLLGGESLLRPLLRDQNVIRSGITGHLAVTVLSYVLDRPAARLTRPVDNSTRVRLLCAPFW